MRPFPRASATALLIAGAALCAAGPAVGQTTLKVPKTAAGATIENTASASYDTGDGNGRTSVPSNTVTLTVDELIDVFVDNTDAQPTEGRNGATKRVTTFRVANTGNGPEHFRLAASGTLTGDDFDPDDLAVYLDAPGGVVGRFDEGDILYAAGTGDPDLPQDGSAVVFVLATLPTRPSNGQTGLVRPAATSTTGNGAPGRVIAGGGVGGGDAVIGSSGTQSAADGRYRVAAATVALAKSQSVADPFGSTRTVPGSTITYTLEAEVSGSGSLSELRLTDSVPKGSSYQAGSIALEGASKSDAADGDEARFESGTVTVLLGTVPAGERRTVAFRVTVD